MAFQPASSIFNKVSFKGMLAAPWKKLNRRAPIPNYNEVGHRATVPEMSCNPGNLEPRRLRSAANVCDYDYELGRSAFHYLLTDATYSVCKDKVDVYFTDVFDNLFQSFPYKKCYKELMIEGDGSTTSLTGQENYIHYSRALFILVGSIRRQEKDEGISKLLTMLSTFVTIDCEQPMPNSAVHPSGHECLEGGPTQTIMESANPISFLPEILPSRTPRPEVVEPPMSTPLPTSFQPPRAELVVPPAITSHTTTPPPTTSSDGPNGTEDVALYSTILKELGDEDGRYGVYVEERVNFVPPLWKCTVVFREVQGVGESLKKRTAKHKASRSAYLQLGYPALG